jgi:hypothetical protein
MGVWRDPERGPWLDRWRRRGELAAIAGFTSGITTATTGHSYAAAIGGVVALIGVYLLIAPEAGWWLPDRKQFAQASQSRFIGSAMDFTPSKDAQEIARRLDRIANALDPKQATPPSGRWAVSVACAECGRSDPDSGERWKLYFADIGEVVIYCPRCAEREFGAAGSPAT